MTQSKRASWSDAEHLHLIDLVEDRFAPFRLHGHGPVFWRVVADEMNATFGSNRTPAACQVAHSQLSTGVIPRPASPQDPEADATGPTTLEEIRDLLVALKDEVVSRDSNRANFQSVLLDLFLGDDERKAV